MSEEAKTASPVPETKKQKMSIPESPDNEWPEGEFLHRVRRVPLLARAGDSHQLHRLDMSALLQPGS